jgi:hypothetical protein
MHCSKQIEFGRIYDPVICINHEIIRNERRYDLSENDGLIGVKR